MQDRMVVPAHLRDGRVDVQRVVVAREPVQLRLRLADVLLALGVRRPRGRLDLHRVRHARAREAGGADREGSRLQPVEQLTVRVEQLALRQITSIASPLKPRAPKSPRAPAPPARWLARACPAAAAVRDAPPATKAGIKIELHLLDSSARQAGSSRRSLDEPQSLTKKGVHV